MAINVITVSGNLGKDCEVRVTPNGKSIGSFSIAAKSGWGDNEKTSWLTCKIFGKQADGISQYLTKGSKVTVTGEFVEEKWQDQQGQERSMNVILVRDVELPPRQQQGNQAPQQSPQRQHPAQQFGQQYQQNDRPQQQQGAQNQSALTEPSIDFDDDIPFAPIGKQYANHLIYCL